MDHWAAMVASIELQVLQVLCSSIVVLVALLAISVRDGFDVGPLESAVVHCHGRLGTEPEGQCGVG